MDPITAFQVAASVITFVEFGRNILTEAREVYQSPSGTPSKVVQLGQVAKDLAAAGDRVSESLIKSAPNSSAASDEKLLRLCGECNTIKNEFQQALTRFQARGNNKLNHAVSSVSVAFKTIWSQSKIDELDQQLRRIQSEMTMAVLMSLWERETVEGKSQQQYLERIEASINQTNNRLDNVMHDLIQTSYGNTPEGIDNRTQLLRELSRINWKPDRVMVIDDEETTELFQQDIIDSLWFSSIESRDRSIPDPYKSTYNWIFSEYSDTKFVEWLRGSDDPLYWITGKAGSGKSTLMKYIVHHASTIAHLSHWAGKSPVLFIYLYFWEATTQPLQYTQEGLLRTLLWQSFKTRPELIPVVAPHRWTAKFALHGLGGSSPEWTLDELEETFRNLASLNGSSFNLTIFIDGLDEFDGEPEALVGWVKRAVEKFGIKVCVGSRPWTAFADGFEQHPSLTMQHLTASDIEAYVDGHFNTSPAFKQWQAISVKETEKLRQQFLIKADGVFLWVYVVVKDLMSALAKGKSLKELHAILDALPVDVIKMYTKIYENLDPNEAATASRYLAVRLASAISLTTDVLWSIEEKSTAPPHDPYESDLRDGIIERRLDSSTRGMLELSRGYIEFHHRSVREWLLLDDVSQLMESRLPTDFNATLLLLQEHIRGLSYYGSSRWDYSWRFMAEGVVESFWAAIAIAFQYANMASESAAVTQSIICMLDRFQHVLDEKAKLIVEARFRSKIEKPDPWMLRKAAGDNELNPQTRPPPQSSQSILSTFSKLYSSSQRLMQRMKNTKAQERHTAYQWFFSQDDNFRITAEDSFVGVAAQYAVVPYVMAKIKENKQLIKQKDDQRSLLHNAIFGFRMYRECWFYFKDVEDEDGSYYPRLELVKGLLDAGAATKGHIHLPKAGPVYQVPEDFDYIDVIKSLPKDAREATGPEEYWNEVIRLLQKKKRWEFGHRKNQSTT
ncbi:hypothetical protein RAB80_006735 [Fusarium oxysporum f. sp. vasinfectum]|uniref:Nephrocystin 3-like N-terminal domain-containing protein n=1 Tax=Fusarium oxysporum f. sp. vasinfectum 25433 TaxID=1089449 RepID=X0KN08_FUSOX|nr:hypothetical protein FOTG_16649 [Fusarium oxysporum f. sp. vasinfectum 25433]KAK2677995.1 hypothetical protein RAB80_006735 [Fusarium oxysporum f. sp. vasinfectum]